MYQDPRLDNFPLYCRQCHKTSIIKI
ncbi:MAG: hypothetical protein K2J90_07345 [Lachnospiraceae bacterium]|nr:hypothetical protein [Lachnospiraceae bacterium]